MMRVISVTFCYRADKLESGNNFKVRENYNLIMDMYAYMYAYI